MSKVVTKIGDNGMTLLKKRLVPKTNGAIRLIGKLDSVNALIGFHDNRPDLQNMLYRMSAVVMAYDVALADLPAIEEEIQSFDLSVIKSKFVRCTHAFHIIRTAIREAEILAWEQDQVTVARHLNRLSDLYFVRAITIERAEARRKHLS